MSKNVHVGLSALLATGTLCTLLIIGATFAFIKYRDLKKEMQSIGEYERAFRPLRWIIPLLLLGVVLIIYSQFRVAVSGEILLSGFIYILAVLEYVNYFQFQLMYDNRNDLKYLADHKRLKRGLIVREFDW
ncbi:MAG: hypothetical protein RLP44_29850 [Aggregatilineales bacterium]